GGPRGPFRADQQAPRADRGSALDPVREGGRRLQTTVRGYLRRGQGAGARRRQAGRDEALTGADRRRRRRGPGRGRGAIARNLSLPPPRKGTEATGTSS